MIWLASYPRSGNTWLRFMLTAVLRGDVRRSRLVEATIPDIHKRRIRAPQNTPFAKTHFCWGPDHPYRASTSGAVLLLRHPLDVVVSTWNYGRLIDQHVDLETIVERFIVTGRIWSSEFSWADHARSWADLEDFPLLTVRYEDLLADPVTELTRICEFAKIDTDEESVRSAAQSSHIDRMRKLERQELNDEVDGIFTMAHELSAEPGHYRFVNRGESQTWTNRIGEEQFNRLTLLRGPEIRRLGYAV